MTTTLNPTRNTLSGATRLKMVDLLSEHLADLLDLGLQAKQAHWNVKGPHFIGLHELFDKVSEELEEFADEIAERAVELGVIALGTVQVLIQASRQSARFLRVSCKTKAMKLQSPFREPVRVLRHGDGGVTYVSLTRFEGQGLADGAVIWDIPTDCIPFNLRSIGSEFLVIKPRFTPEDHDTPDEIRQLCASVEVHELQPGDTFTQY